jgi:hypothetical protein
MRVARSIVRAPPNVVNFLEGLLFHGHLRSKTRSLSLLSRRNIYRPVIIVLNYYG